jgi:putative hydrolase of the HAD superfamily
VGSAGRTGSGARLTPGYPSGVRFRAVFFDVGETLVHPAPSYPELFSAVLLRSGVVRSPEQVVEASRVVFHRFSEAARDQELWTTSPERSERFWKGVYDRMLRSLDMADVDGLSDLLYREFTDITNYALFDDVRPMIRALGANGLTLGIVSNFEAWLEDLLVHLGIRESFPVRVISGIEGVEKPDPRIFGLALARSRVDAADAAFVGDNPEFDVVPAEALGMTTVLIDRRGRFPDHDGIRIEDLRDLAPALDGVP